jgi:hypothetical protein
MALTSLALHALNTRSGVLCSTKISLLFYFSALGFVVEDMERVGYHESQGGECGTQTWVSVQLPGVDHQNT